MWRRLLSKNRAAQPISYQQLKVCPSEAFLSRPSLFALAQQWHNGRIIVASCDAAGIMTTLPMKEWTEDDDDDNGCWTIHDQSKVEEDI